MWECERCSHDNPAHKRWCESCDITTRSCETDGCDHSVRWLDARVVDERSPPGRQQFVLGCRQCETIYFDDRR